MWWENVDYYWRNEGHTSLILCRNLTAAISVGRHEFQIIFSHSDCSGAGNVLKNIYVDSLVHLK